MSLQRKVLFGPKFERKACVRSGSLKPRMHHFTEITQDPSAFESNAERFRSCVANALTRQRRQTSAKDVHL
jgi:hypothetical protein